MLQGIYYFLIEITKLNRYAMIVNSVEVDLQKSSANIT